MLETDTFEAHGVRVAIEGCGHGTLDAIYAAIDRSCKERGWDGVDLVIIGGDFQAARNAADLSVMSVPAKYRALGDFPAYYRGARRAPYLTLFVGGNHEAAAHLWELYYGGWVAPNIYYLGAANVVRLGPLRIAAMSGIWKGRDYRRPHHERLPFGPDDVKTFYHVRELDVRKLLQLRTQVDVGISHDWPRAVERHGDERHLFRMKPDFEHESRDGSLGNPAAEYVMDRLRPAYWFSAHLHCKFAAVKTYEPPKASDDAEVQPAMEVAAAVGAPEAPEQANVDVHEANPEEIDLGPDTASQDTKHIEAAASVGQPSEASVNLRAQLGEAFARSTPQQHTSARKTPGQPVPPGITNTTVRFLALDKCLPGRKFLQVCELAPVETAHLGVHPPSPSNPRFELQYDPEWLAITRVFHQGLTIGDREAQVPPDLGHAHYLPLIQAEQLWVEEHVVRPGKLGVPNNFAVTAPVHEPGQPESTDDQPEEYTHPQIEAFCSLIGVKNLWAASEEERLERKQRGPPPAEFADGSRGGGSRGWRGGRNRGGFGGRGRPGRGRGRGW